MKDTFAVEVTRTLAGFVWAVRHPNGPILKRAERALPDTWEAFTAGHNAERLLRDQMSERGKRGEVDAMTRALVLAAMAA